MKYEHFRTIQALYFLLFSNLMDSIHSLKSLIINSVHIRRVSRFLNLNSENQEYVQNLDPEDDKAILIKNCSFSWHEYILKTEKSKMKDRKTRGESKELLENESIMAGTISLLSDHEIGNSEKKNFTLKNL